MSMHTKNSRVGHQPRGCKNRTEESDRRKLFENKEENKDDLQS